MQFSETIDAAFKREEERQARQIGQLHRYARAYVHCLARMAIARILSEEPFK